MKFVKERMKEARTRAHHTQESLAELLNTDKRQISRWESGETVPSSDTLADLAEALNVSADFLLGLTDDPTPHIQVGQLSNAEKMVIMRWRQGDRLEALKLIIEDER